MSPLKCVRLRFTRLFPLVGILAAALSGTLLRDASALSWTWIGGSPLVNQPGQYGTLGVPDTTNVPGARYMMSTWTDPAGTLWMFGGTWFDTSGTVQETYADLWKFDGSQWTWVKGPSAPNVLGAYLTQGTPNPAGYPGARQNAMTWRDASGNLWLFGGVGYGSSSIGRLSDLWKFDGSNWTWVAGNGTRNRNGVYGTKGVAAAGNIPGARGQGVTWVDGSGNLWLFGGSGYAASTTSVGSLNDLWKFDGTYWTWVGGDSVRNVMGVYGTKGVASVSNWPGARSGAAFGRDAIGRLWMFGGTGYAESGTSDRMNDLWRFDGSLWTWVSGAKTAPAFASYGTRGVASAANVPGGRSTTGWSDQAGAIWIFGGSGYGTPAMGGPGIMDDVWKFDGSQWTWMLGDSAFGTMASYGTRGVASSSARPGARLVGQYSWSTPSHAWVFGGVVSDTSSFSACFRNDLWMLTYKPDLAVTSLTAPTLLKSGCLFKVRYQITNRYEAVGTFRIGVYFSTDANVTSGDALLASVTVPALDAGQVYLDSVWVSLPQGSTSGYLGVIADDLGQVDDLDPANDVMKQSIEDARQRILSILDVKGDQGGQVRIRFTGSDRDVEGSPTPVLQYEAFRRVDLTSAAGFGGAVRARPADPRAFPMSATLAGWEFVGAVPAHGETEYNIVVPTLRDSSGASRAYAGFFIRAATAVPTTYFDSCPDSGYSVDNLAPAQPAALVATYGPSSNTLHWRANTEQDLLGYRIYRGASSSFVPGEGNLVAQTSDTTVTDPAAGSVHYKLSAIDVHGNESVFALVSPVATGIEPARLPCALRLGPAVPNPATHGMRITFDLPRDADVLLAVHDVSGRLVRRLVDGPVAAGARLARWDGRDAAGHAVAPGMYFCRLNVEGRSLVSRVVVAR